ncbi:MAG TPA: MBL fold metallo-hydrolase [Candidatus Acidoferrales bacterium]|jgi:L-ascorbate metabolism protein UlaG (beta-lactamase superfamily)|nr:MBL fold metallo-hydrolase [Candidatus Acidoferrales bacterium]
MQLQLVRHATLLIEYAGMRLLVDPMLSDTGAMAPIQNSPQPRNNPLVPLPCSADEVLDGVRAVLVTHTHRDHWDDAAIQSLPKDLPLFCQPEDLAKMEATHFVNAAAVSGQRHWSKICITRTHAQHGTGEIGKAMAPASGYVLQAEGEPTLYVAGDTIWCPEVAEVIQRFEAEMIVVNAGGARFLEGDPITMTAEDVVQVCRAAPNAEVVAVHMEAINHCLLTRNDLAQAARAAGVNVKIPADGEVL